MADKVMVVSNMDLGDDTFDSDVGSWNITRARRGCQAGKHELYTFNVMEMFEACKNVEVDADKVAEMVADPERLLKSPPVILAMEDGKAWLIDGHHRVNALYRLGAVTLAGWVIEETDEGYQSYRIWFNGRRVAPWHGKQ